MFFNAIRNMAGVRKGRLTVLPNYKRIYKKDRRQGTIIKWECQCDCGKKLWVATGNLNHGNTFSCGCRKRDKLRERNHNCSTHGMRDTREYRCWVSMIQRCRREPEWAGRGISVCDSWRKSFLLFLADVGFSPGPRHQLNRINNDGNYEPGNVEWATSLENSRNRRNTVRLTYHGVTKPLVCWADEHGVRASTVASRLKRGWSVEDALETPAN